MMNIRFEKQYKSIQAGFEWTDVPNFAIITGVNGAGKTQLLRAIEESNPELVSITNETGVVVEIVARDKNANRQSVEKLVDYKNSTVERLARKTEQENLIKIHRSRIEKTKAQLQITTNDVEKQRLKNDIVRYVNNIKQCEAEIKKLFEFAYEKELDEISHKLGKEPKDLTDEEVLNHANPYFNTLTDINDFENYLKQECEEKKEALFQSSKRGDNEMMISEAHKECSYHIINRYFKTFGFRYFEMQDPFAMGTKRKGELWFKGEMGEEVEYADLSSGEQMIVKFIFWTMGKDFRGNRINTMLLDEPDSSLHPSMCQMMVNILHELSKPKEEGGSGIRIIITTHSPSTVAFAPEENLFVMEKGVHNHKRIRNVSVEDAEDALSEGILTYRKSISTINLAIASPHKNLLFVEGKTDVMHIRRAMEVLRVDLDVDILPIHDADSLGIFIRVTPPILFNRRKMIALFDCDKEGRKAFDSIRGNDTVVTNAKQVTAEQCEGLSFALIIQPYDSDLSQYCPIEFLYSKSYLEANEVISKRGYSEFKDVFFKEAKTAAETQILNDDFKEERTLRSFEVNKSTKTRFAENIVNENNPDVFEGFRPTLELIKMIIETQ